MSPVGVVAAMAFEARCLGSAARRSDGPHPASDSVLVRICGIGGIAAARAAHELVDAGATSILSWGTAAALDPTLTPGTLVMATEVIWREQPARARYETASAWLRRAREALPPGCRVVTGPLLTSSHVIPTVEAKAECFRHTGALAVDMESAAIAEVAAARGVPFMSVRAVLDTAHDSLPAVLTRAVRAAPSATSHERVVLLSLLHAPGQWGQFARLARRYQTAARALRGCARATLEAIEPRLRDADA